MDFFIFHFDWQIAILVNTVAPSEIMKRHFSDQNINKHWLMMCVHLLTSKNKPVRLYLQYSSYSQFLLGLCNRVRRSILCTIQLVSLLYIQKMVFSQTYLVYLVKKKQGSKEVLLILKGP